MHAEEQELQRQRNQSLKLGDVINVDGVMLAVVKVTDTAIHLVCGLYAPLPCPFLKGPSDCPSCDGYCLDASDAPFCPSCARERAKS